MDKNSIGAAEFIKNIPDADGRGVIVFILDSGVDPSVKGLTVTSEGKTKVIDMQDFTEQVVIDLKEADKNNQGGTEILEHDKIKLEGWENLKLKPADGKYYLGVLDENKYYKNSGVPDINNNGKTDDMFAVLSFKISDASEILKDAPGIIKAKSGEDLWVYYIDEDLDGHIDDEKVMFDYKYRFDSFNFFKGEKDVKSLMALSANIDPSGPKLVINTNDNAHGTHCAGIATGYKINGQDGLNGIAPGAYVVSLKIGNDVLSGGATVTGSMKKAYEYGVKFLKDAGFKYGVFSMSYGIGSETPGRSDVEEFLSKFSEEHPEVIIVKSMGNSGPGINTTGNPSGDNATLTVGAMISPETLRDLYGSGRKTNWITHFSGRGGAVAKPDIVASGAAASTVPGYVNGDAFWGTSMSTPQAAGACALLFSAALKNDIEVDGFMIKKAVNYTAAKMKGYSYIDYGNGLIDINKAFEYLKILASRNESKKVLFYDIKTDNTFYDNMTGTASYWNVGGYMPQSGEKQNVSISAVFPPAISEKEKAEFYRVFSLKSSESWLGVDKSNIYLRGTQGASFGLQYDTKKLDKPGIYTAKIYGYTENEKNGGYPDFDVQATVVVPYKFTDENNYRHEFKNKKLNIGDIERYFIEVPSGASSMNISLNPVEGKHYNMAMYVYNPVGEGSFYAASLADLNSKNKPLQYSVSGDDLEPGVWEVIPYSYYKSTQESNYNLDVKFYTISADPEFIDKIEYEAGEKPGFGISLFNSSDETEVINASGKIEGYSHKEDYKQQDKIAFKKKFKTGNDVSSVLFEIEMPTEDFNKMTDIAVNVYNLDGKSLVSSGLERKIGTVTFNPPGPGEYEFEIYPGFVSEEVKAKTWTFSINEKYYYNEPISITADKNNHVIYPQKWYSLNFTLNEAYPVTPNGFSVFGEVSFVNRKGDMVKLVGIEVE